MTDFISELERQKRETYIEFCKSRSDAKLPSPVDAATVILYAAYNYEIYTGNYVEDDGWVIPDADGDIEIDTGVKIKYAKNVELTVFAPVNLKGFDAKIIEKESELKVKSEPGEPLTFKASELFRTTFLMHRPTTIRIKKGDPICFLKVAPITQVWMHGVQYE